MKTYIIDDLNKGCFVKSIEVNAKSPLEAVKKIYPTARRVYHGGNIVVFGKNVRGSWLYDTEEE